MFDADGMYDTGLYMKPVAGQASREERQKARQMINDAYPEQQGLRDALASGSVSPELRDAFQLMMNDSTPAQLEQNKANREDQTLIQTEFAEWVDSITPLRTFLHWGGRDLQKLAYEGDGDVIDVINIFRVWLERIQCKRTSHMSLTDAVDQVLGPSTPFKAHRAYEDAVMTAAVFMALSETGGVL
jgi:hypothetical protein